MVRTLSLLLLAAGVAGQTSTTPVPTPAVSNPPFTMTLVNSIQARVVAEAATWDETNQKFGLVLKQNTNTFEERYRAVMDTVNTASVEGALYYVQTEGIDKPLQTGCMRKTNMSYIWFLNITMVQPTFAIAEYQDNGGVVPEYGKFVAMDGGLCTPVGTETPLECLTYGGLNFNKNLGQWVGGEARKKNGRANYDDNYWFSFPNSCYTMRFDAKTKACRDLQKGGLCPIGTQPDGVKCTYSFDVLGYLAIDDLVGITSMKNTLTGQNFKGFSEFCKAGKTEYNFADSSSDLTFWNDPLEPAANANRTKVMMQKYNDLVQNGVGDQKHMKALPSVEELTKANPPCWKNSPRCATAANGCRRKLLSQICEVCSAPADDCKKPGPNDKAAPMLNKQFQPALPTDATGNTKQPRAPNAAPLDAPAGGAGGNVIKGSGAAATSLILATAVGLVALAFLSPADALSLSSASKSLFVAMGAPIWRSVLVNQCNVKPEKLKPKTKVRLMVANLVAKHRCVHCGVACMSGLKTIRVKTEHFGKRLCPACTELPLFNEITHQDAVQEFGIEDAQGRCRRGHFRISLTLHSTGMVRTLFLTAAAALATLAAGQATTAAPGNTWTMTTINSVQARVVSDAATWDETNKKFGLVLKQNTNTFEERYRAAMDTVNTASVEGALFYVQTEGINRADSVQCMRKTNMSYIWFLNITIVQPTYAIAEYADNGGVVPEFGKFMAMDNGQCTPVNAKAELSDECQTVSGLNYHKNIGPYIGGEARLTHAKGNYADNYWFSYPNSCYSQTFVAKNDKCRKTQPGGLCPLGTQPDGVKCTYSFDILGYIRIDDLVGITSMKNAKTGEFYRDRVDFCKDGKVEYDFDAKSSDLTFWDNPLDVEANKNRTSQMLKLYNSMLKDAKGDYAHMKPLPSIEDLTKANPPCWMNSPRCATATNGCRRKLSSQICEVCSSPAADCKKPTSSDKVPPPLTKAALPPLPTNADGKTTIPRPVAVPGASGAPGDAAAGVASDATSAAIGASALVVMTAFLL
ncbi:hypothetical protein ACHHYP_00271 [Achlya hypogyna]|uniref:Secreted protein n=1 Tax=Achlya hypogyna TaxID=1202772 RepID=A0A1V9ZUS8_ACHHY|nr:hypothetical protein ACHHYP_00271 [Achlya hypogyna]